MNEFDADRPDWLVILSHAEAESNLARTPRACRMELHSSNTTKL